MTARLVIVRHGNTFASDEPPRRIGSRTDLPLVSSGRTQAAELSQWFATHDFRFDRAMTSRLRRTRETADMILAGQKTPPSLELSDLLAEIDHGVDEDCPEADVIDRLGSGALDAWERDGHVPSGWIVNPEDRIARWAALLAETLPPTTLLVTSNGAARFALLADARLRVQSKALPSLKLRTGAFGIIDRDAQGTHLVAWDERP